MSTLERPLVAADDDEEYEREHGVPRPGNEVYAPPGSGPQAAHGPQGRGGSFTGTGLPSQADEMREVSVLARDASEILWEMVAMGEAGSTVAEMRARAEQLRSQLRGLINDYSCEDENVLAQAFEAFEMLERSLDDQKAPGSAAPAVVQPPLPKIEAVPAGVKPIENPAPRVTEPGVLPTGTSAVPPPARAAAEEAPLIEL